MCMCMMWPENLKISGRNLVSCVFFGGDNIIALAASAASGGASPQNHVNVRFMFLFVIV
jgi:hypothetical protein